MIRFVVATLAASVRGARLATLVGALAIATPADAQSVPATVPRIVLVSNFDEAGSRPFARTFLHGMRGLGHVEGRTFRFEVRYADLEPSRAEALIHQVVAGRPDVLIVTGLTNARRARDATRTIPVVVASASDLVDAGVVTSLSRPGGNITGITDLADEGTAKRLELLKELLVKLRRVALLTNPDCPATPKVERRVAAAAQALGIAVLPLHAKDRASLWRALDSLETSRPDALLVAGDALFTVNAGSLIERATASRVPVAHYWPGSAEAGAVISYQADIHRNFERTAFYVDRILKGTLPRDLPIEQPTRYELVVNRKAATALGVALSPTALLRADRIID